jgi:hypothetical protein
MWCLTCWNWTEIIQWSFYVLYVAVWLFPVVSAHYVLFRSEPASHLVPITLLYYGLLFWEVWHLGMQTLLSMAHVLIFLSYYVVLRWFCNLGGIWAALVAFPCLLFVDSATMFVVSEIIGLTFIASWIVLISIFNKNAFEDYGIVGYYVKKCADYYVAWPLYLYATLMKYI